MKNFCLICVSMLLSLPVLAQDSSDSTDSQVTRNTSVSRVHTFTGGQRGAGIAPANWAFASQYSGTAYGTGYYFFRTNNTYNGYDSLFGNDINQPPGLVGEIRAIHVFDLSGLMPRGTPQPVYSAFILDRADPPAVGTFEQIAHFNTSLEQTGSNSYTFNVNTFFQGASGTLNLWDAEDFENANPFTDASLAFSGNLSQITSAPLVNGQQAFAFDVSSAVQADLPDAVPTLGTWGLIGLMALLAGAGVVWMRKQRSATA